MRNTRRETALNTSVPRSRNRRILVLAGAAVVVALSVRIWHDRKAGRETAVSDLEQRIHTHPDDEQAQLDWGNALHTLHRDDEAEAALKTAAGLAPTDPRPINSLAMLALERKRPIEALGYFHTSVNLDPHNADIWRSAGLLLQQQHDFPAAIDAFEHATQLDPKDAVAWRQLGVLEHARHYPARCIQDLQRAAVLAPEDAMTQTVLGTYAFADGKLAIAKQAFDRALALRPDDPEALVGSARVTLLLDPSPAGLTRAGRQIDQAITTRSSATAYLARGQWNLQQRRYQAAVADLKTALSKDPQQITAHSLLSRAYAGLGQPERARTEAAAYTAAYNASKRSQTPRASEASGR